jgi:CrcB protein
LSERLAVAPWVRASASIGFLGAYTTFSTLSLESYRLLEARSYSLAGANLLGSVAAGMLALYGGVVLGRAL